MISESNRWMNKHQLKRVMTKQGYFNNKASCRSLAQTSFCNQQWSTAVGVTRNGTQWRPWDMEKNHSIDHSLNNTWQYHLNVYQYTCCITLYRSCIYIQKHWIGKDVYFSSRVIANTRTAWKLRPGTAFHDYLGNERSFSFYLSLSLSLLCYCCHHTWPISTSFLFSPFPSFVIDILLLPLYFFLVESHFPQTRLNTLH